MLLDSFLFDLDLVLGNIRKSHRLFFRFHTQLLGFHPHTRVGQCLVGLKGFLRSGVYLFLPDRVETDFLR